ncbi:MAG: hypothetical protein IJI53_15040, partial [Clostridia bacterium]|nr:hypothetical protein [Clostridia bacterium]
MAQWMKVNSRLTDEVIDKLDFIKAASFKASKSPHSSCANDLGDSLYLASAQATIRGCRPPYAENDPLDHFPGAS